MPKRSPSPQLDRGPYHARDLDRVEHELARLRGAAAARGPAKRAATSASRWRARVDVALLEALLAGFLRAVGLERVARRGAEILGVASFLGGSAPAPFASGSAERAELERLIEQIPWIEWGARGLDELIQDFGVEHERKALGKFYTPRAFVDHVLDHTLSQALEVHPIGELKVLEPACGSGDFAVPLLERLADAWVANGAEPRQARRLALERNLFAVDRDPVAVVVTRIRLLVHSIDSFRDGGEPPIHRIAQENALWDAVEAPATEPQSLELPLGEKGRDAPLRLDEGGGLIAGHSPFHVIVGNPPYGAQLSVDEKRWLRARYRLARGRTDTAALFLERALEVLAPRGQLGFVMPHSFSRSGAYRAARTMLSERLSITTLADLGNAFPGIAFNTMIVTGTSGRAGKRVELYQARGGLPVRVARVPRTFLLGRDTLPLHVAEDDVAFYSAVEKRGVPLRSVVRNERGHNLSKRRARLIKELIAGGVPVVQGRDLTPYVPIDLATLPRVTAHDADGRALEAPAVAIQNVSNVIEATLLPSGVLPLDTVNVLTPTDERIDPFYLIAVLNSRVIDAYFRDLLISHATLTVHLDDPVLGGLPVIAPPDERTRREIGARVRSLLGLERAVPTGEARRRMIAEIDALVNRAYGVSDERAARLTPRS